MEPVVVSCCTWLAQHETDDGFTLSINTIFPRMQIIKESPIWMLNLRDCGIETCRIRNAVEHIARRYLQSVTLYLCILDIYVNCKVQIRLRLLYCLLRFCHSIHPGILFHGILTDTMDRMKNEM